MLSVNRLVGGSLWADVLPPELLGAYLLLVALLVFGTAVVVWAARRYRRPVADDFTPEAQLERFRLLKEKGELSSEEFEKVRALLGQRTAAAETETPKAEGERKTGEGA
jgi:hypothetical protein